MVVLGGGAVSYERGTPVLRQDDALEKCFERLVLYCRATSASTAPCTSRRTCCSTHCASYCAPKCVDVELGAAAAAAAKVEKDSSGGGKEVVVCGGERPGHGLRA